MGTAPITKNSIRKHKPSKAEGATPIEKNVIVVDEQGNEYEATYPKRAKGLVKNGRARFVAENKICLACPPNKIMEENKMENNNKITLKEIFCAIGELIEESGHIELALTQLEGVRSEGPGDIGAEAKANSIAKIVELRETTLQRALSFYEKMYEDLQNDNAYEMKKSFEEKAL